MDRVICPCRGVSHFRTSTCKEEEPSAARLTSKRQWSLSDDEEIRKSFWQTRALVCSQACRIALKGATGGQEAFKVFFLLAALHCKLPASRDSVQVLLPAAPNSLYRSLLAKLSRASILGPLFHPN